MLERCKIIFTDNTFYEIENIIDFLWNAWYCKKKNIKFDGFNHFLNNSVVEDCM